MSRPKTHVLWSGLLALAIAASACAPATTPTAEPTQASGGATSAPAATAAPQATTAPQATDAPAPTAEPGGPYTLPEVLAPADASGDIVTAGTSTVFPVTEKMAELFEQEGYVGSVTVDSIGTGAGFERFCVTGETDVSNASRAINAKETASCFAIGRNPLEFRVGTDALAVAVNPENDFVDYLTLAELATAFSTAKTWADVRAGWPAEPIQRFSPGTDSGTFDYFVEAVMRPANENNADLAEAAILNSENTQFSEDDNVLVQGVEGGKYAIGYFGYAYYVEEADKLKAVPISKNDPVEGVEPNEDNVNNAKYPLARPLFIYSDAKILQEKPQVAAFIKFYLDSLADNITDVGYFPAPESTLWRAYGNLYRALGVEVDVTTTAGDIVTAGSSTVFPLTEKMAEVYQNEGAQGTVTVDSIGTGAGFERFCKSGETDISNASRAIKKEETEACQAIGREPVEFRVGTDALAVVVSADNTFVDYLTLAELATAFSTAKTWADVRAGWPAEPIQRFSPGTDSGTFDYFVEAVMAPANLVDDKANIEAGEKAILNSENTQFSEDDNVLAQGVEGGANALGYFGYAYYAAEGDKLRAIPISAKDADPAKAITPDVASVNAGTYPLARPLFIYSDAKVMQEKAQVAAFIAFYLTQVNEYITEVGYFPASDASLGNALGNWMQANGIQP
ncbi:MAG: PstS family phosphate ABC transporter substrate-binding protein [Anaerolineales bacterium]